MRLLILITLILSPFVLLADPLRPNPLREPSPKPTVELSERDEVLFPGLAPQTTGCDADALKAVLQAQRAQFRACHDPDTSAPIVPDGNGRLRWRIDTEGRAEVLEVKGSMTGDILADLCITTALEAATFKASEYECIITFTFPSHRASGDRQNLAPPAPLDDGR